MRKSGIYMVCDVPEKLYVDSGMWYCTYADKETLSKILFTVIYRDPKTKYCYIKRCRIEGYIMNRDYFIAVDGMEVLHVDTRTKFNIKLNYVRTARTKIFAEVFKAQDFDEKGIKAQGVRFISKEVESIEIDAKLATTKSPKAKTPASVTPATNPLEENNSALESIKVIKKK